MRSRTPVRLKAELWGFVAVDDRLGTIEGRQDRPISAQEEQPLAGRVSVSTRPGGTHTIGKIVSSILDPKQAEMGDFSIFPAKL